MMEQTERFEAASAVPRRRVGYIRPAYRSTRISVTDLVHLVFLPAIVTALLWSLSVQQVSLPQAVCAWVLLCLPWGEYLSWKRQRRQEASLFVFVAAMYWLYYGVALFLGDRRSLSIWAYGGDVSDDAITQSMLMAAIGVTCMWCGVKTSGKRKCAPKRRLDIHHDPAHWDYIRIVLAVGTLFSLFSSAAYLLGEGGRQLIISLQSVVPLVAFIILFRHYVKGAASRLDKVLLLMFFVAKFATGISGGWLGGVVSVVIVCFIVYLSEKRRIPWLAIAPVLFYMFFFQAGKSAFRSETWDVGDAQRGAIERIERWGALSLQAWQEALDDKSGEKRNVLLQAVVMRNSLLTQTAHVIDETPGSVPFQLGGTYSYLAAMWVPRFLWPDKPTASEANRFYQLAYGLTEEKDLDKVSISAGTMTEGYINFGWFGAIAIMYALGLLFNWVQTEFLDPDSGLLFGAIGVGLIASLSTQMGAQLAMYVSGLIQQNLLALAVFLPAIQWSKRTRHRRRLVGGAAYARIENRN